MRRCQQQGTRIIAEIANPATICDPKRRQPAESKLSPPMKFSATRSPHLSTVTFRAAFYYLLPAADAHNLNCLGDEAEEHYSLCSSASSPKPFRLFASASGR